MNLRQTAELAALASLHAEEIISWPEPVPPESLHAFWKSSRVRLRCWFAALRSSQSSGNDDAVAPHRLPERVGLARSILVAELLTRVWSAVLVARDRARSENVAGELVRNVFAGQLEARREVLKMLADEHRLPMPHAATIDRLRRRVERWTDMLLGPLVEKYGVTEFAFDESRACEAARSEPHPLLAPSDGAVARLTLVGLAHAIPRGPGNDRVGAGLDAAVAQSVLSVILQSSLENRDLAPPRTDRSDQPLVSGSPSFRNSGASDPETGLSFAELREWSLRPKHSSDD